MDKLSRKNQISGDIASRELLTISASSAALLLKNTKINIVGGKRQKLHFKNNSDIFYGTFQLEGSWTTAHNNHTDNFRELFSPEVKAEYVCETANDSKQVTDRMWKQFNCSRLLYTLYIYLCVCMCLRRKYGGPENLKAFHKLIKPDTVGNELDPKKKSYF